MVQNWVEIEMDIKVLGLNSYDWSGENRSDMVSYLNKTISASILFFGIWIQIRIYVGYAAESKFEYDGILRHFFGFCTYYLDNYNNIY